MDTMKPFLRIIFIFYFLHLLVIGVSVSAAALQLQGMEANYTDGNSIPAGTYLLQYKNSISTLVLADNTTISNITYSLGVDNMEHIIYIQDSQYAMKNSTDITWVFPNSLEVNRLDRHLVEIKTDFYSPQYLPITLSRTMNQTEFSGEGYQKASFTVSFENITYAYEDRLCDSIWTGFGANENKNLNATMLLDTFSTDAPGTFSNNIYSPSFNWNRSTITLNRVYNFSVVIRVIPNGTTPVIFSPYFGVVLFNGTYRNSGTSGTSTTMPDDMLPPHLTYATASQNVSLPWSHYLLYGKGAHFNEIKNKVFSETTKIGVVRNNKTWILDASGNGAYGAGDLTYTFGAAGDVPVTGDWNGNSTTEIGVVRNNKTWLLDASGNGAYGAGDRTYTFGMAGDVPVTGDWTGNGTTKIGVVRSNTTWLLDASGDGKWGPGDYQYTFGKSGDVYVTGDWNNDHKTEIGVVRNNKTWLLDASGNGAYGAGDLTYTFGTVGDRYVTGDWAGNGMTRIGVVRSNTTWLLDASGDGKWGPGDYQYTFGKAGDRYVTGKWS